jgi:hypothetical protein
MSITNLFGNVRCVRGFMPLTERGIPLPQSDRVAISGSNTLVLGYGSPITLVSGVVLATVAGDAELCSGVITQMFDSAGQEVNTVPASTSGYECIYTTDPNQIYIASMDETHFAATDIGKFYNLVATEPATANTNRYTGASSVSYSMRQLDSSTEATSAKQFQVVGLCTYQRNDAGVAGTLVKCQINPVNFTRGA